MSFCIRPLLFCLSIVVLAAAGGGKASATKIQLVSMADLVNKEDAAFLETLAQSLRNAAKPNLDDFTVDSLDFVRADLNGDGVEEFIVQASTPYYTCGNSPTCHASVYSKTQEGWRFIGNIGTIWYPGVIHIEDTWSNGWRTTNNEEFRFCWFNETDPQREYSNYDMMGMPMESGQAGYFGSVDIKYKCPKTVGDPMQYTEGWEPPKSTELFLTKKYSLFPREDAAFLETVAQSFKHNWETVEDDFSGRDLYSVKADLNGDGVEEFLITPRDTYECRYKARGSCVTSIYERSSSGWVYIGYVYSISKGDIPGQFLTVEDETHNGWRIINNGGSKYCWVNSTAPGRASYFADFLGLPMEPGQPGYFEGVGIDETCPEKDS